ncbi:MAG: hypothetical protein OHK0015_00160 [Chloroflexi bacterium OHK40]
MSARQLYEALRTTYLLLEAGDQATAGRFGLPPILLRLLAQLDVVKGRRQVELTGTLLLEPSTMTRAVDRLEQAGLVRRSADPSDRRALLVRLTPAGQALRDAACSARDRALHVRFATLTPQEQHTLAELLARLRSSLQAATTSGEAQ